MPTVDPRAAEPQHLREPHIDLVDAIAVERARLDQVDGDRLAAKAGKRTVQADGGGVRRRPVRGQLTP